MTTRGIIVLIVDAILFYFASAFSARELYVLAWLIGIMLLISFAAALFSSFFLKYSCRLTQDAILRKESIHLKAYIEGFSPLPSVATFYIAGPAHGRKTLHASRKNSTRYKSGVFLFKTKESVDFDVNCPHTGVFVYIPSSMSAGDALGLFRFTCTNLKNRENKMLTVLPIIFPLFGDSLDNLPDSGESEAGRMASESGENFSGTRGYQYGDQVKRIHWKQTVRTQSIYVRKFENEVNPNALIVIDTACAGSDTALYGDIACEACISMARYYIDNNQSIKVLIVRSADTSSRTAGSYTVTKEEGFDELYQALSGAKFSQGSLPFSIMPFEKEYFERIRNIHIISNLVSESFFDELSVYIKNGYRMNCITPLADTERFAAEYTDMGIHSLSDASKTGEGWGEWL